MFSVENVICNVVVHEIDSIVFMLPPDYAHKNYAYSTRYQGPISWRVCVCI